ncbi:MAG: glucosyl-3-phosphoglycerate synthase, partial [Actinomycetota bacterium]|nr:glucosyl-3-phosphoglycerate synthase [Actinomycetota bacterium]
ARAAGADVYQDHEILPEIEAFAGKGEALWKSLFVLRGDIVLWLDADITNFHPRFVYGPLGPLLTDPEVGYVKSFYRRPLGDARDGGTRSLEGGRVTELAARPLLNLLFPELAGVVQPLSGEYAGRRAALAGLPFFTGYAVETGLLVDLVAEYGLNALAQADLGIRVHRNRDLTALGRMSSEIQQAILAKAEDWGRLKTADRLDDVLVQFEDRARPIVTRVVVEQRPPMDSVTGTRP